MNADANLKIINFKNPGVSFAKNLQFFKNHFQLIKAHCEV